MPGPSISRFVYFLRKALNDPGCEPLLVEACENGADLIGGCPYTDTDPHGQIAKISIWRSATNRHRFSSRFRPRSLLDAPGRSLPPDRSLRMGRRVAIGHATKLSALDLTALEKIGLKLRTLELQ